MTSDHRDAPRADPAPTATQEAELRALIPTEAEMRAALLTEEDVQRALLTEDDVKRALGLLPFGPRPPSAGALRQRRYRARRKAKGK